MPNEGNKLFVTVSDAWVGLKVWWCATKEEAIDQAMMEQTKINFAVFADPPARNQYRALLKSEIPHDVADDDLFEWIQGNEFSAIRHVKMHKDHYARLASCFKTNGYREYGDSVVILVEVKDVFKFVQQLVTLSIPFEYLV